MEIMAGQATRTEALARLRAFLPRVVDYSESRNFDLGPDGHKAVSQLSPYVRHRLLLEPEIVASLPENAKSSGVLKFKQEVYWRTYWKGWLEQRPAVWRDYVNWLDVESGVQSESMQAILDYRTGIECFDYWTRELIETGYLHNHARMWYASIWIFTLKLSWQSGADLFMRHLLDGDAASNTLSWRWVAGLQTRGKHYLARADNIERFTQGRFNPVGQLGETSEYPRHPLAAPETLDSSKKYLLLLSEDDCLAEYSEIGAAPVVGVTALTPDTVRFSEKVQNFKKASVSDAMNRACKHYKCEMKNSWVDSAESLAQCFTTSGADAVLSLKAPVGSTRDQFQALFSKTQIPGVEVTRAWDREHWPKASAGYFKFKKSLGL